MPNIGSHNRGWGRLRLPPAPQGQGWPVTLAEANVSGPLPIPQHRGYAEQAEPATWGDAPYPLPYPVEGAVNPFP